MTPPRPRLPSAALLVTRLVAASLIATGLLTAACVRVQVHGAPDASAASHETDADEKADAAPTLRVATYNTSLNDDADGGLVRRLDAGDANARSIARVLQRVRPDLVLLNEFDYDDAHRAADLFQQRYLEVAQGDTAPLRYPYRYLAPVNTGEQSGLDLDNNGRIGGEGRDRGNDAWGYGLHPGQYGMLVLSRYPIDSAHVRSFRLLKWSAMPDAQRPYSPTQRGYYYNDATWAQLRLSSKSHWDVPVDTPLGRVHFLVSHPTPPAFDGPEDRNGARNADELRLWTAYLDNRAEDRRWLCDDAGVCGGLPDDARFVVAGDLNNDPIDGQGRHDAIRALIDHPRMLAPYTAPRSAGAVASARAAGGANAGQQGDPAEDTGDFGPQVGNLHIDYVLPSQGLRRTGGGVFWPAPGDADAALSTASDHHAVWVDLAR